MYCRERLDSTTEELEEPPTKVIKTEKATPRVATVVRRGKNVKAAMLPVVETAPATPATPAAAVEAG